MVFKQDFPDGTADAAAPILYRTRPGVDFIAATDPKTGARQYFAKDRASGELYHFGEEEFLICQLLDGSRSLDDIKAGFKARFGLALTNKQFSEFLRDLHAAGFLAEASASPKATEPLPEGTEAQPRPPFRLRLFNAAPLFAALAWFFWPVRYLLWLLPPATLLAGLILFDRRADLFMEQRFLGFTDASMTGAVIAAMLLTGLVVRFVQGSVAYAFGAAIKDFGVTLWLGLIPGFYLDLRPIHNLPHRERVWCCAAPLLVRLSLFALGTFFWISLRPTASTLSEIAFLVGQVGFWSLIITSIPFLPMDGYLLLSAIFDRPDYMDRTFRVLGMRMRGQPLPQALRRGDKWLLLLFAGAVIICITAAVAGGILLVGAPLEDRFRGAGVSIFLAAFGLAAAWTYVSWRSVRRIRATAEATAAPRPNVVAISAAGGAAPARPGMPGRPAAVPAAAQPWRKPRPRRRVLPYAVWAVILGGLAFVAFLPYPYEAGGDFVVLPSERAEVRARVDGEVLDVLVKEGDWVEESQPLARLSAWDKLRDLAVAKASLEKARAELQVLLDSPKPEDVALAESQVAAARVRTTFTRAEANRQSELVKSGTASKREAEHAMSEYKKDLADLGVAEANLANVKSGPTAGMFSATRAEVTKYEEQVAYLESQLERAQLRATAAGRVVTPNIDLQRGMYLTVGTLFAVIEQSQKAQAEILVPETDIGEVEVDDQVRLKPWGDSDIEIFGQVVSIAPSAEKTPYGPVVRVKTEFDNADGFLRSDMTGYAKIAGSEMPVWKAYTRLFVRFFNIEVWSWIP